MSEVAIEEKVEQQVDFSHYVTAVQELVEGFRDILVEHTAKLDQKSIDLGGRVSPEHIAEKAELNRLRIGCDHFLNCVFGNY